MKSLAIMGGAFAVAFGAAGVLHLPFARTALARLGGCPIVGTRMTAKEMDRARHIAFETDRRPTSAPSRPVVGFALDTTTLADVRLWAQRQRVDCRNPHPGLVVCANVPAAAIGCEENEGAIDELALGFDQRGRLVNETTLRAHLSPDAASRVARAIVSSLGATLGPPAKSAGAFEAARLGESPERSISAVSYRFGDYVAEVSTMNLSSSGPLVREHYMSAHD